MTFPRHTVRGPGTHPSKQIQIYIVTVANNNRLDAEMNTRASNASKAFGKLFLDQERLFHKN